MAIHLRQLIIPIFDSDILMSSINILTIEVRLLSEINTTIF